MRLQQFKRPMRDHPEWQKEGPPVEMPSPGWVRLRQDLKAFGGSQHPPGTIAWCSKCVPGLNAWLCDLHFIDGSNYFGLYSYWLVALSTVELLVIDEEVISWVNC